jgi:ParB family chromosome partitioning protein
MAVKRSGLGRGLDALFPEKNTRESTRTTVKTEQENTKTDLKAANVEKSNAEKPNTAKPKATEPVMAKKEAAKNKLAAKEPEAPKGAEIMVKISNVEPNREQPRKVFDEANLQELAESIKQYGVLQPLLVSKKKDYYEIVAGERRWRAAKLAGMKEIPVLIKEFSDQQVVEVSLIENIQREDLNPIEEAMAYKRLMEEFQLKQDEIAEKVSKSRTAVTNSIRLLKLDERVQKFLINDEISAGHARTLLSLPDGDSQFEIAKRIIEEKLSVREVEKLVKNILDPPAEKKEKTTGNTAEDAIYEQLEERMKRIMGTKVFINRKKNNKGKIEIEYYSKDELERIIEMFESID